MKKMLRKIKKSLSANKTASPVKKSGSVEGRLADLEIRHDALAQDVAILKAELQLGTVRQQALVDYYETRIDRIYARLSADLAGAGGVSVTVEQDQDVDGRLVSELRQVLKVREDLLDLPLEAILSDHLAPGVIGAPLTLQGFRLNRAYAAEAGDKVVVSAAEEGKSRTVLYGPYKTLLPGRFRVTLNTVVQPVAGALDVAFDIYCPTLDEVVGKARVRQAEAGPLQLPVDIEWPTAKSGHELELRVHQKGDVPFEILGFEITEQA